MASPEPASADPAGPEPVESVQDLPPVSDSLADDIPTADDDADSLSDEPIAASELGESDTDFAEFGTAVIETDVEGTSPAAASATSVSDSTAADRAGVFGSAAAEGSVADGAASDGTGFDGAGFDGAGFEPAAFEIVDSESTASEVAASDAEEAEVALPETTDHDVAGSDVASADVEPVVEPERRRSRPESAPAPKSTGSGGHAKQEGSDYIAPSLTERVLGCFLGGALGDSLGSDLEFVSAEEITERFGPQGPRGLREAYGVRGAITDDTQMTLFTAEGLIRGSVAQRSSGVEDPLPEVQLAYQRWLHTQGVEWESAAGAFHFEYPRPDGWLVEVPGLFATRAPGKTVFRALSRFADGEPSGSFTEVVNDSKGCGGVMRAAPAALYSPNPPVAFELAARTAALTHGHSSGYLPAGAMAVIVQQALLGQSLDDGVWLALQVLETWDGHEETSALLKEAVDLAADGVPTPQQIEETLGGGWVGEQALAIAVCAALAGGDDVELALRVAVHHSGDSDSVGAICGNIVGSLLGVGALPVEWLADLELRGVVEQMALDCVAEFGGDEFTAEPVENRVAVPGSGQPTDEVWHARYPARPLWSDESGADSDERSDRTGGDEPRFAEVVESAPAATFPPAAEQDSSERSADQDVPDRHRSAIEDDRFSSASRQSPAVEEGPAERSPAEQGVVDQESWPVRQSPAPTERIRRSQLKASDAPESSDSDAFGQWAPVAEFPAPKPAPRRINTAGGPTSATPGQRHDS